MSVQYSGGHSVNWRDIIEYTGGIQYTGVYHEYSREYDIPWCTHDIFQCTHDIPTVLMIPHQCTEHPPMYCTPPVYCTDIVQDDNVWTAQQVPIQQLHSAC